MVVGLLSCFSLVTMSPHGEQTDKDRFFVQAPIPPLKQDGLNAFVIGTIVFAVLTVICWARSSQLAADDRGWWLWVCLVGVVIGLCGIGYCLVRRQHSAQPNPETSSAES